MTSDVITLPDGRRLSWHEFGDPDGSPVIYTAGTPVSGLGGASYGEAARAAGLRWISPDKPGYGASDYHRERTQISWGDDLATPVAFARRFAGELPDATLHISESSGHDVGHDRRDEIVSMLASYAK